MKKIGISGHSLKTSSYNKKDMKNKIFNYLNEHFLDTKIIFNLGGANGTDNIVAEWCIQNNKKYNLYLPFDGNILKQYEDWNKNEQNILKVIYSNKLCINKYKYKGYFERNREIINNSDLLLVWYEYKINTGTNYTIEYGLKNEIQIYNIFNNKYITKKS